MFNKYFKKLTCALHPRRDINNLFKEIIIEISYIINSLKFDDIDQGIEKILAIVLKYLNADRAFLFVKWRTEDNKCSSYKYIDDSFIVNNNDSSTQCKHIDFIKTLPDKYSSFVYNNNDKKSYKKIKDFYDSCKMKSAIIKQLIYQEQEHGFLTFDSIKNNKWSSEEFQILSLVSNMLINLIMKRRSDWESLNAEKIVFEKLKINEEEQRLILENITDMVWKCDLEFNNLYLSPSAFDVTGYTLEELKKHDKINNTFTPKSIKIMYDTLNKYKNKSIDELKDTIIKLELEYIHKDKHIFPVELIAKPLIENNKLTSLQGTIRDITQRKSWEEKLTDSQNLLSRIIDSAEVLIFIKSIDNKYLLTNKQHRKLFGEVKYGETDSYELFSKEEADQINKNNLEVFKLKQNIRFEETTTVNGIKRVYLSIKFPVFDLNNEVYAIGCVATDITESKLFEEEISRLYTAVENSSSIVVITNLKGDIEYVNPKFNDLTGFSKDEVIGKNPRILKSEQHEPKFYNEMWHTISSGKIWKGRICNKKKDGEIFWELASIAPVFSNNKIINYIKISEDITERKQWEDKLIESEILLKSTIESNHEGILAVSTDNRILVCNNQFKKIFNVDCSDINDCITLRNLVRGKIKNEQDFIENLIIATNDFIIEFKDGRQVRQFTKPMILNGEKIGLSFAFQDITKQIESEIALKKSEKKFRALAENQHDVFWVVNEKLEYDYISPSCLKLTGHTVEEVLSSKGPDVFYTEEEYSKLMNILANRLQNQLNEKKAVIIESIMIKKDGTEFPVEMTCIPQIIEGQFKGIQGITRDITERKQSEMKLKDSEKRYRNIFDNTNSAVAVFKPSINLKNNHERCFIFIDINNKCEQIENIKKEDVIGKKSIEIFPSIEEFGLLDIMKQVYEDGISRTHPLSYYKDERIEGYRENFVSKLPNGEIICIYDDLTEIIKQQEEKEILQKQLLIADKLNSIGSLASGIAHNFNNMITVILNNVNFIYYENEEMQIKFKKHFREIFEAITTTSNLVKNVLRVSSINDDYKQFGVYDINDVLKHRCNMFAEINKNIIFETDLDDKIDVKFNLEGINSIIMNILINSSYAMNSKGKIQVFSKIETIKSKEYVKITFIDNGCGIEKDIIERVFDPFFTTKGFEGNGLGLSTAYKTIIEHNGFIEIESEVNKGTKIIIYLPYNRQLKAKSKKLDDTIYKGNNELCLIIDDEDLVRDSMTNCLKLLNYDFIDFDNGIDAIEYYKKNYEKVEVVFIDFIMPSMTGNEVFLELIKINKNVKVIMTSGYADSKEINKILQYDNCKYLQKPFTLPEVSVMLKNILEK